MLFIKLSWVSESLKTQERLLSQPASECHLATGVLNVFSQFNHFDWVWVTIRVNASSLSLSLFAVEVTSFVAGWVWRSFNGHLALYLPVWNMFYIHKEGPECARIMSSFDEYFMLYPMSYYDGRWACILTLHRHSDEQSTTEIHVCFSHG